MKFITENVAYFIIISKTDGYTSCIMATFIIHLCTYVYVFSPTEPTVKHFILSDILTFKIILFDIMWKHAHSAYCMPSVFLNVYSRGAQLTPTKTANPLAA